MPNGRRNEPKEFVCAWCGNKFISDKMNPLYCSNECKQQGHQHNAVTWRKEHPDRIRVYQDRQNERQRNITAAKRRLKEAEIIRNMKRYEYEKGKCSAESYEQADNNYYLAKEKLWYLTH